LLGALVEGEIRPHGQALWPLPDALQPEALGGENVGQKLPWPRERMSG